MLLDNNIHQIDKWLKTSKKKSGHFIKQKIKTEFKIQIELVTTRFHLQFQFQFVVELFLFLWKIIKQTDTQIHTHKNREGKKNILP